MFTTHLLQVALIFVVASCSFSVMVDISVASMANSENKMNRLGENKQLYYQTLYYRDDNKVRPDCILDEPHRAVDGATVAFVFRGADRTENRRLPDLQGSRYCRHRES